jgi:hypothetical protein
MGVSMVKAAAAAAVSKYVFSGVYHPSLSLTNHAGKRPVEEALYGSGMDFTVLRPAMLMQTLGGSWPSVLEQGQIAMPYAKLAKGCYVDYRDVAEVATAAMTGTDLSYGTFELCAPGMVTRVDIAQMLSDAAGRRIQAGQVDVDQWADTAKLPDGPMRDGFKRMYVTMTSMASRAAMLSSCAASWAASPERCPPPSRSWPTAEEAGPGRCSWRARSGRSEPNSQAVARYCAPIAGILNARWGGSATGVSDRRLVLLDSVLTESPSLVGQPNTPLPLPHPADPAREAQGDLNSTTTPGIEVIGGLLATVAGRGGAAARHGRRQAAAAVGSAGALVTTPATSARARPRGSASRAPGAASPARPPPWRAWPSC